MASAGVPARSGDGLGAGAPQGGLAAVKPLGPGAWRTSCARGTRMLGECLGRVLAPGDLVVLTGDLGAGKTCLTGGVAAGLGDGSAVTSPTFTIMAVHDEGRIRCTTRPLPAHERRGARRRGIYDVLDDDGACLVEWGEAYVEQLGEERST